MRRALLLAATVVTAAMIGVAGVAQTTPPTPATAPASSTTRPASASAALPTPASSAAVPTRAASAPAVPSAAEERLEVPPPPFSDGIYPCSSCHGEMPPNRTRRVLVDFHDDIVLRHDQEHRWCLDCHDADNRDVLHLASGERVGFDESYRLCGQCHGEKYRDWRAGVHGRRTGDWNGHKKYLLCANCHNPHQPRFRAMAPKPAPQRPTRPGH